MLGNSTCLGKIVAQGELPIALSDHDTAWLVIAMASTPAGNFTVLGSIANLIVVQKAAASGVAISFWSEFGAPLTIITLAIGTLWLWL